MGVAGVSRDPAWRERPGVIGRCWHRRLRRPGGGGPRAPDVARTFGAGAAGFLERPPDLFDVPAAAVGIRHGRRRDAGRDPSATSATARAASSTGWDGVRSSSASAIRTPNSCSSARPRATTKTCRASRSSGRAGPAADEDHRGDQLPARRRLHRQRRSSAGRRRTAIPSRTRSPRASRSSSGRSTRSVHGSSSRWARSPRRRCWRRSDPISRLRGRVYLVRRRAA